MKEEKEILVYLLAQTTLLPQWTSLMGDKYRLALPFKWAFTNSYKNADIISWDGAMNFKSFHYYENVLEYLRKGQSILLLQREAYTLIKTHPFVTYIDLDQTQFMELPGGNVLPEDLLSALEMCHKKLNYV